MAERTPVTPVTIPKEGSTVAASVLLLVQVPPVMASDKVIVRPEQTVVGPVIAAVGFTVTGVVT